MFSGSPDRECSSPPFSYSRLLRLSWPPPLIPGYPNAAGRCSTTNLCRFIRSQPFFSMSDSTRICEGGRAQINHVAYQRVVQVAPQPRVFSIISLRGSSEESPGPFIGVFSLNARGG